MKTEKAPKQDKPQTTISYYGKKKYRLNPLISIKKPVNEKVPDYRDEEGDVRRMDVRTTKRETI